MKKKVFLGGTCAESTWREYLISKLDKDRIDYFNPVVEDWTEECMDREIFEREHCDYVLYTITPLMQGVYSIAEVVDDSNKRPEKTLFCVLDEDNGRYFTEGQIRSLNQVSKMVSNNGGKVFISIHAVSEYLNNLNGGIKECYTTKER